MNTIFSPVAMEKGIEKGRQEGKKEVIEQMLKNGVKLEQISTLLGQPEKEIRQLLDQSEDIIEKIKE